MRIHIHSVILLASSVFVLAGCKEEPGVRVTREKPVASVAPARSEPVFYNGRTYRLELRPSAPGVYDLAVSGMGPKQRKDAEAVAVSSLGYFACAEGQRGQLQAEPAYLESKWHLQAKCG